MLGNSQSYSALEYQDPKPAFITPAPLPRNMKKVSFQTPQTMAELEYNRRLNSTRQVIIKKGKNGGGGEKQRRGRAGKRAGCESLFSQSLSGKSNMSAPTEPIGGS